MGKKMAINCELNTNDNTSCDNCIVNLSDLDFRVILGFDMN